MNVILVSSEHAFPNRLRHPRLSFSSNEINDYIFAGEVPPNSMYELLTYKWKMEPNLALAFIDYYGGNIFDVYKAIYRLSRDEERFCLYNTGYFNDVRSCLEWKGSDPMDRWNMRQALTQLVHTGFYVLKSRNDPIAKVISKHNVGGVVKESGKIIGLSPDLSGVSDFETGIIPTKQSMRLVIAKVLSSA